MGKAVEPCIYSLAPTKTKPAGYRVRKWVQDQYGDSRQVTKSFRGPNALQKARAWRDRQDAKNQTGVTAKDKYVRFDVAKSSSLSAEEQARRDEVLMERVEEKLDHITQGIAHGDRSYAEFMLGESLSNAAPDRSPQTLRDFVEKQFLPMVQERNSASDYSKKKGVWAKILDYSRTSGHDFASLPLSEIRPSHIDGFVHWLENQTTQHDRPYSKDSIKTYSRTLKAMVTRWAK